MVRKGLFSMSLQCIALLGVIGLSRDQLVTDASLYTVQTLRFESTIFYPTTLVKLVLFLHLLPSFLSWQFGYNHACSTFSLYSTRSSPSLVVRIEWI